MTKTLNMFDAMLKCKDGFDFYLCVNDAPLDASDCAYHKEIAFMFSYNHPLMHGSAAACVHIVN